MLSWAQYEGTVTFLCDMHFIYSTRTVRNSDCCTNQAMKKMING